MTRNDNPEVAFVLSGGAGLGAIQVGMLHALYERGIAPDVISPGVTKLVARLVPSRMLGVNGRIALQHPGRRSAGCGRSHPDHARGRHRHREHLWATTQLS